MPAQLFGFTSNGRTVPPPIQDAITRAITDWAEIHDALTSSAWKKGDADTLAAAREYTDGKTWARPTLTAGDADKITTRGVYTIASPDIAHLPIAEEGVLEVLNTSFMLQRFTTWQLSPRQFHRIYAAPSWGPWVETPTAASMIEVPELDGVTDLDTLTTTARWHQSDNSQATTALHYPPGGAGWLNVVRDPFGGYVYQQYQTYNNTLSIRRRYAGTWSPWATLADTTHTHGIGQIAGLSDALTGVSTTAKTYTDDLGAAVTAAYQDADVATLAAAKAETDKQIAAQRAGWAIEQAPFEDGLYIVMVGGQLAPATTGLYKIGA